MSFWAELKRRHVVRVGIVYAAVAFVVLQVADLSFTRLGLPDWAVTLVLVLALLGFPISIVLAWAFELTPAGVRRTVPADVSADAVPVPSTERRTGFQAATTPEAPVPWKRVAAGLTILLVLVSAAFGAALRRGPELPEPPRPLLQFEVSLPDSLVLGEVLVHPDGERLLLRGEHGWFLYTFADMGVAPFRSDGFDGAEPFRTSLSPDGAWVAYLVDGSLRIAPFGGGAVRTLADSVRQAAWGDDGFLYIARGEGGRQRIQRLAWPGGGMDELLAAEDSLTRFEMLPLRDGRTLLHTRSEGDNADAELYAFDLRSRQSHAVAGPALGGAAVWFYDFHAPSGHVLIAANDGVYAARFDADRFEWSGAPIRIVPGAVYGLGYAAGMIAYTRPPPWGPALIDRRGARRELPDAITPSTWSFSAAVSPSGDALTFWKYQTPPDRWDVWSYRLPGGPQVRISHDSIANNREPRWSVDGRSIQFIARKDGVGRLVTVPADGSAPITTLLERPGGIEEAVPLPGDRFLITLQTGALVLASSVDSAGDTVLVEARFSPRRPAVSPDGRWVAYSSAEVGGREVFVRALDGRPGRWRVSSRDGDGPAWSRAGDEVFFATGDSLYAAAVDLRDTPVVTGVRALFRINGIQPYGFDVLPGDSLFVVVASASTGRTQLVVVANLLDQLRGREAGGDAR